MINLSKRCIQIGIILLLIIPSIIAGIYIATFGVNVIYWDQWSFVYPILSHWYQGSLSFQDLFAQHNEHRLLFPNLFMLGIAVVTSYNTLAELACSYILLILNLFLIYMIFLGKKRFSWTYLMLFIPVAWLVCSLQQYENLLWGFQIPIFLSVTGVLIAIFFLDRSNGVDGNLAAGIFGGVLSSFSFFNGLMIWPTGFVQLIMKKELNLREIFVWVIASIATTLVFFNGWIRPKSAWIPSLLDPISKPIDTIDFFVSTIVNSLGFSVGMTGIYLTIIIGIIFLVFVIFVLYRIYIVKKIRVNARFISLILFAFLSGIMLTIGRGSLGLFQSTASRYVTFMVLGVIGVYFLFVNLLEFCKNDLFVKRIFCIFCLLLFAGIIVGTVDGLIQGPIIKQQRLGIRDFLLSSSQIESNASVKLVYSNATDVLEGLPVLKKYNLNVFSGAQPFDISHTDLLITKSVEFSTPSPVQESVITTFESINGSIEPALFEHSLFGGSHLLVKNVMIPTNSSLNFEIALDPLTWSPDKGDGVEFQIYVNSTTSENLIFSQYIDPKHNVTEQKWNPCQVDLSHYAKNNVTLIFSTLPGPINDSTYDWAWWGNPRITISK